MPALVKPLASDQVLQRLGVQRPHVRDVADVALEERDPARGVQRLEHQRPPGRSLWPASSRNCSRYAGLQVLDDLRGENPAERRVRRAPTDNPPRRPR